MNLICLKRFESFTPPTELMFTHTNLWVQLHNLPLGCMNIEVGTRIEYTIGTILQVDVDYKVDCWRKWLRVLVEVDLMKPLARGKTLELIGQRRFVQFKYERLPKFCFNCGVIRHALSGCTGKINNSDSV